MIAVRERLPDKRRSWTQKVKIESQTFYLSVGLYDDGRPGEIFLNAAKEGTFIRGMLDALARNFSIALQNGVHVHELCRSIRHLNFSPRGIVHGSANVETCTSVPDWIAQELMAAFPLENGPVKEIDATTRGRGL